MLIDVLKNVKIYNSSILQNFILSLENRFNVQDEISKYSKLVNFSDNLNNPYHKWFRYREGFAGRLIDEVLVLSEAKKGELIIDPFCGAGTTPVVAVMSGFHGLGIDINPMSALITSVKMRQYSDSKIDEIIHLLSKTDFSVYQGDIDQYESISRFFNKAHFRSLLKIKEFIDSIHDKMIHDVFLTSFLSIIEPCSDRKRDGNGLKTRLTSIKNVQTVFIEKFYEIIDDLKKNKPNANSKGFGLTADAKDLFSITDQICQNNNISVGAIIFSPPYANSFDYFESYKMELVLGGFVKDINSINDLRKGAVRSFIGGVITQTQEKYIDLIAQEIEDEIPLKEQITNKKDSRTRKVPNMIRGYFSDMSEILAQCSLCLPEGKKCYIVVDQSSYLGKLVPTDLLLAYLAEERGFKVSKISICRKAKTSGQQLQKYPYLSDSLRESIIELEKL